MIGNRAIPARLRSWTPVQLAALVFGAWWTLNGVTAFTVGGVSLTSLGAEHEATLLGLSVAANGWHGLFHLSTGLLGLAVCAWPAPSRAYAVGIGAIYLAAALSGFVDGNTALGVMYVDTLGSTVHAIEGAIVLAAALLTQRSSVAAETAVQPAAQQAS